MKQLFFLFVAAILCTAPTCAQSGRKAYCATARTQLQLNRCWAREAESSGKRLAAAIGKLLKDTPVRGKVETAQTKWAEYRDAQCDAVAAIYEGGSMQPMQRASCVVHLTDQRIAELEAMQPEGK